MSDPKKYMLRAIELARNGMTRGDGGPFGAVVVKDGRIIGEGWNQVLSSHDPTAHGEIMAIRNACMNIGTHSLDGCEIHTTGEPCPMCMGAILWARIHKIFHGFGVGDAARAGFDDSLFYEQISLPKDKRSVTIAQLCPVESRALLDDYLALPGRIPY